MERRKIKKQRIDEAGAGELSALAFFTAGGVFFAVGIVMQSLWLSLLGGAAVLCGVPFLLYFLNHRVYWDTEGITVQTMLRQTRVYSYREFSYYYSTNSKTVFVLKSGKKISLRDARCDFTELARAVAEMKRHCIFEDESKYRESRLFWGNCSRPVQYALFLLFYGLLATACGAIAIFGCLPTTQESLTVQSVRVFSAELDPETKDFWLTDTDGNRFYIKSFVYETLSDEEKWQGKEFILGVDAGTGEVCTLRRADQGEERLSIKDYNVITLQDSIGWILFFALLALLSLAMITVVLVVYRFPDRFPNAYVHLEVQRLWSRHGR